MNSEYIALFTVTAHTINCVYIRILEYLMAALIMLISQTLLVQVQYSFDIIDLLFA